MGRPDFSQRSTTVELMDTEDTGFDDYRECLRDLARVNRATLAYRPTLGFLRRLARTGHLPGDRAVRIVDAASGYGDMLRRIAAWAQGRGLRVELTGIDLNPRAARVARAATPKDAPIEWVTGDVFDHAEPGGADVVISSLFAHHLDGDGPARLIDWMEETARIGWFINDLHRHPLPHAVFSVGSRIARWHRFVQYDGPVSITRAFTPADWRGYLAASGVPEGAARIEWWMPFRLCVSRVNPT